MVFGSRDQLARQLPRVGDSLTGRILPPVNGFAYGLMADLAIVGSDAVELQEEVPGALPAVALGAPGE